MIGKGLITLQIENPHFHRFMNPCLLHATLGPHLYNPTCTIPRYSANLGPHMYECTYLYECTYVGMQALQMH